MGRVCAVIHRVHGIKSMLHPLLAITMQLYRPILETICYSCETFTLQWEVWEAQVEWLLVEQPPRMEIPAVVKVTVARMKDIQLQ